MKLDDIRQGFSTLLDSMSEGWQRLRQSAASALTGFKPGAETQLPERGEVDDAFYLPSGGWSMLGGDVFEDNSRVVVRIEMPGLNRDEIDLEIQGDVLIVTGEKRFERETTEGRYRVLQCAYGHFRRAVPLPAPVLADQTRAKYLNGVLRVELQKRAAGDPRRHRVNVE